jgi:hypothetical protein
MRSRGRTTGKSNRFMRRRKSAFGCFSLRRKWTGEREPRFSRESK